jgi:hypothetical protein
MTSTATHHTLATPLTSVGNLGYPIEDNIDAYLDMLYQAKLFETLKAGYPGKAIIHNLADVYAQISEHIFWNEDERFQEALAAFPLFVDHILQTKLEIIDLSRLSEVISSFYDEGPSSKGQDHLADLNKAVQKLEAIFKDEAYKTAIYSALEDKARTDFFELIAMANWCYDENTFELYFSYAQHQPVQTLFYSHWLIDLNDDQIRRFISWARTYMPADRLTKPLERTYEFNVVERAVLERVLLSADKILGCLQDRLDFIIWGLSSPLHVLASNAAWLLEDIPVSQWPEGSPVLIQELLETAEPWWTSWKRKERKYTTVTERLMELLKQASL